MATQMARRLRQSMTGQEVKLWVHLRQLRVHGVHFRRQAPIDGYIVDFACFAARLIIELDGGQHGLDDHRERDRVRDAHLAASGFKVLRFWNGDVDRNLEGVIETICREVEDRTPSTAPR
jgi:very-short-patch-repair endonuclease